MNKEKNDKAWEKYKKELKCKRCPNQIDPKNKFTDDLCNSCYYKEEEFDEKYGEGFITFGVTSMLLFLLVVLGLIIYLI